MYATRHRNIPIPSTVDEWQLYDSPGSRHAADSLTEAAREAIDMIANARLAEAADIFTSATKHIYAVCGHFADDGAMDSEPMAAARDVVLRARDEYVPR